MIKSVDLLLVAVTLTFPMLREIGDVIQRAKSYASNER